MAMNFVFLKLLIKLCYRVCMTCNRKLEHHAIAHGCIFSRLVEERHFQHDVHLLFMLSLLQQSSGSRNSPSFIDCPAWLVTEARKPLNDSTNHAGVWSAPVPAHQPPKRRTMLRVAVQCGDPREIHSEHHQHARPEGAHLQWPCPFHLWEKLALREVHANFINSLTFIQLLIDKQPISCAG